MTCSHADENCPFIPAAQRISLSYEDPKVYDGTYNRKKKYMGNARTLPGDALCFSKMIKS
ncbi:MAG: hypothetical protein R2806_11100 [Saprospiraceae bacterium]